MSVWEVYKRALSLLVAERRLAVGLAAAAMVIAR